MVENWSRACDSHSRCYVAIYDGHFRDGRNLASQHRKGTLGCNVQIRDYSFFLAGGLCLENFCKFAVNAENGILAILDLAPFVIGINGYGCANVVALFRTVLPTYGWKLCADTSTGVCILLPYVSKRLRFTGAYIH